NWMLGFGAPTLDLLSGINDLTKLLLALSIVFVLIGIALAIGLGMSISKPITNLVQIIDKMAKYDLTIEDNNKASGYYKRKDEIGIMAKAVFTLQNNFKTLITNIASTSEQLAASSQQLTSTSHQSATVADEVARTIQEIAQGANDQAKDTEQGAIQIEALGHLVEKDHQFMIALNEKTNIVDHLKDEGFAILEVLIEKTKLNNQTSLSVRDMIIDTNQSARKIESASQMIKSIANQTNLLALNAAIEAARAGEAGRGFAVVADEIRKLAEQSNGFTEEIAKIIEELTSKTEHAVNTMEEVGAIVNSQTESVEETHSKFEGISEALEGMKTSIDALNQSSKEMGSKKDEIVSVIENLSAISEENAAGTEQASASIQEQTAAMEEIADSSESLARLAEDMQMSITQFKY
ncbi:MAG: methyl-accepting chemotaxis protein, partial [Vallitaleaceae bacterium]|nr:methyl-accepting chemotaxis protein [Vallitaleaceae bacterium]